MSQASERPSRAAGLAPRHRFEQFIPRRERIFVNRNLRMSSIRWVGFDMDHTLAVYNRNFIEALAFDMAKETLIESGGYPDHLREVRYNPDFGIRGLVVDKEQGNILKMDKFRYVSEAYHGLRSLDKEARKRLYMSQPLQLSSNRFWSSDTLFGLPEIALYASVVEALETAGWPQSLTFMQLFDDIRSSVDLVHRNGALKGIILQRMTECFLKDPKLPLTLDHFRRSGKRLFLLTNSDYEYTHLVLSYLLGDPQTGRDWWDFFDLIVVDAMKPEFFIKAPRWRALRREEHQVPVFSGGNFRLLERRIGERGDAILYVGDHIFGDILRSKKSSGWRTVMIVEELDHEIAAGEASSKEQEELDRLQMDNDGILDALHRVRQELDALRGRKLRGYKSMAAEKLASFDAQIKDVVERERTLDEALTRNLIEIKELEREVKRRFNPFWGSLCKVESELSRFGDQMADFACLYTSRVSNFLSYPPEKYFMSPEEFLPHEI